MANEPFSFDPRIGSPAGGDAVRFTSASIDFACCGTPQVLFGGIPSPRVTVINASTLTATTPPQAEGVVDVQVRADGKTYTTFFQFGYARAREQILIPVAVDIPGWTTEIQVFNDSEEAVNVFPEVCSFIGLIAPCGSPSMMVAPKGTARIPSQARHDARSPELYVAPPADLIDRIHFSVRVHNDADNLGTEIPTVRLSQFRRGKVIFLNVPMSAQFRRWLRVYVQPRVLGVAVTVRVYDDGKLLTQEAQRVFLPTDGPMRVSLDFVYPVNVPSNRPVRVEVESEDPDAPLWALLTVTDNQTQRVLALAPN